MQLTLATIRQVAAFEQGLRRREAEFVEIVVDRGLLLDIRVASRHVGFGLVVVVVADEVFNGVVRKERLELVVELRPERLVVRQHERGALQRLDHLGDGVGLARAGDAEQDLMAVSVASAGD